MPNDVTRDEFDQLAARTAIVEGEELVVRHVLEQMRRNGDGLATIKTGLGKVGERLGNVEKKFEGVDLKSLASKVDGLDRKLNALARNLPRIVGQAARARSQ